MMKKGYGQANQLRNVRWDVLNHASYAYQLMLCDYRLIHVHFTSWKLPWYCCLL